MRLLFLLPILWLLATCSAFARVAGLPEDASSPAWQYAARTLSAALADVGGGDVRVNAAGGPSGEGYRITTTKTSAVISARDRTGRVYGALRLAREIQLAGKLPASLQLDQSPAYRLRMVEVEAPFYPPEDRAERPSWLGGFRDMYDIDQPPYLDLPRFEKIAQRFERYCQIMLENGYNTLLFIQVESRWLDPEVFPGVKIGDPERQRLARWRSMFQKLLGIAESYGFRSYLWNSEVTFPDPIMLQLHAAGAIIGGATRADVRHPALLAALETKYRYLARTYPQLAGYLFRVGELGEPGAVVFRRVGRGDARSEPERVADFFGAMQQLVVGEIGKELIARTWWVGDPSIHTDPAMYKTAVSQLQSASTWVCIKNTHEFWGSQPLNPTIAAATHPVIVEYQGCREYDGMGSVPVVLAEHYCSRFRQLALLQPAGVWAWVKFGGSGGKYRIPYFYGFEDWTEANVYLIGRLAWDPVAEPNRLLREFAVLKVGPQNARDYARIMALSEDARNRGMYVRAICEDNPWHPMFPTYRNYFYAGELVAAEDGARSSDPVRYIFQHFGARRVEMVSDARKALAERRESLQLAEAVAKRTPEAYGRSLLANVRHGLALQEVLTAWIETADACYEWLDDNQPASAKADVEHLLTTLKEARSRYDRDYGEYVDRNAGLAGFTRRVEETLSRPSSRPAP